VSATVLDAVRDGLLTVTDTVDALAIALDDASTVLADTGDFAGASLPDSLDAITAVLPTIESVAASIDDAMRVLARAPFGPDYDPEVPFDDAIADLETALTPLAADLETVADGLDALGDSSARLADDLVTIRADVEDLDARLADVETVIDRYGTTTADATALAARSRAELADSARLARWLLVALGVVFAAGQVVPLWLGRQLLRSAAPPPPSGTVDPPVA
jgi:DNA repair ATPase RecN